jgi:organic hydroperoxide reductase OsmC/OhrA
MADYTAQVHWQRQQQTFTDQRYSRRHLWLFDGGQEVPGSSSTHSVPLPYSDPAAVDPEEAFVASVSSCHMLWFLSLAAQAGWTVDDYLDDAVGTMARDANGRMAITVVALRPAIRFAGNQPSAAELAGLHHTAHERCYIANSVRSEVRVEPRQPEGGR